MINVAAITFGIVIFQKLVVNPILKKIFKQ